MELDNTLMEEDLLHSPRLPDSPTGVSPDTPLRAVVQWSDQDSVLVILSAPLWMWRSQFHRHLKRGPRWTSLIRSGPLWT